MKFGFSTYIAGDSPLHRMDARIKILWLFAYSISLFLIEDWIGMALATVIFIVALAVSQIPPHRVFGLVIVVYILVAVTVIFNMFAYEPNPAPAESIWQEQIPLFGAFVFSVPGLIRGAFFGVRILLLVFASLIVCFTSTTTDLTNALNSFLSPLHKFEVPTDDIATVFSIAIRFIPVTAEEFFRVRNAQWSRGSHFDDGSLMQRLKAWQTVFIPLFVGLFRRADSLAFAMDARCYGAEVRRTSLEEHHLTTQKLLIAIFGVLLCAVLAVVF